MRLHHLLLVIPFALVNQLSFASNDMDITDVTCTVSHINEVAQKKGLKRLRRSLKAVLPLDTMMLKNR